MPSDYLEIEQIRASLADPAIVAKEAFGILSNISHLLDEGDSRQVSQELVLRALESRKHFGKASIVLDALVRQVGLFPYLSPKDLGTADQIAWEFNHPASMPDDIVFHEPQTRVYRELVRGQNVVLAVPREPNALEFGPNGKLSASFTLRRGRKSQACGARAMLR